MERHFEKELNNLKGTLEKMARLAQESLLYSTRALLEEDKSLAEKCFSNERAINNANRWACVCFKIRRCL